MIREQEEQTFSKEEVARLLEVAEEAAANPLVNHPQPLDDFNYELLF
jgi:hypothetical protein